MNAKFTESRALSTPRQTCRDSHAATCATRVCHLECTRTEELGDGLLGGTEFLVMDKCIVDVVLIFSSCSVVFVVESYALLCQVRSLIHERLAICIVSHCPQTVSHACRISANSVCLRSRSLLVPFAHARIVFASLLFLGLCIQVTAPVSLSATDHAVKYLCLQISYNHSLQ